MLFNKNDVVNVLNVISLLFVYIVVFLVYELSVLVFSMLFIRLLMDVVLMSLLKNMCLRICGFIVFKEVSLMSSCLKWLDVFGWCKWIYFFKVFWVLFWIVWIWIEFDNWLLFVEMIRN